MVLRTFWCFSGASSNE